METSLFSESESETSESEESDEEVYVPEHPTMGHPKVRIKSLGAKWKAESTRFNKCLEVKPQDVYPYTKADTKEF